MKERKSESPLTPRELEILALTGVGMTDLLIAKFLGISRQTVRNIQVSTKDKLGVPDRTSAVVRALHLGLLDLDQLGQGIPVKTQEGEVHKAA